jgi:hypothetical protein
MLKRRKVSIAEKARPLTVEHRLSWSPFTPNVLRVHSGHGAWCARAAPYPSRRSGRKACQRPFWGAHRMGTICAALEGGLARRRLSFFLRLASLLL